MPKAIEPSGYFNTPPDIAALSWATHGTQVSRETFHLPDLWALHFYKYHGHLKAGDYDFVLHPGSVSIVPPSMTVTYDYRGPSRHLYCHFQLDTIPSVRYEPQFLHSASQLNAQRERLEKVIPLRHTLPHRANARLWDILHELVALDRSNAHTGHEAVVDKAMQLISQDMSQACSVSDLAQQCDISHNQFTRIIKEQTGLTPCAWMKKIRMERAAELLTYSDLPIKVIAYEVGIPNLQHFNKSVRQHHGRSPRDFR